MTPEQRIERLFGKLSGLGPMLPGSISKQWNVCGTEGCACKAADINAVLLQKDLVHTLHVSAAASVQLAEQAGIDFLPVTLRVRLSSWIGNDRAYGFDIDVECRCYFAFGHALLVHRQHRRFLVLCDHNTP